MKKIKISIDKLKKPETMNEIEKEKIKDELIVNAQDIFCNHYGLNQKEYQNLINYFRLNNE